MTARAPHKPRIILQTKTYRVIATAKEPFEGKPRPDEIDIEELRTNRMGEKYWGPVHNLWDGRVAMTKDERFMLQLFGELAAQSPEATTRIPTVPEVGLMLMEVAACLTDKVTIEPRMPFDPRGGAVGIALTPGVLAMLAKLFPAGGYSPRQLVLFLLEQAAKELV